MKYPNNITYIVIALACLVFPFLLHGSGYEISGLIESKSFGLTTNVVRDTMKGRFQLFYRDGRWKIIYAGDNLGYKHSQVGVDDNNDLYNLLTLKDDMVAKDKLINPNINSEIAKLLPGINYLATVGEEEAIIWWVYASSDYLKTNDLLKLPPLLMPDEQRPLHDFYAAIKWKSQVSLLDKSAGLPGRAFFYDDGVIRSWTDPEFDPYGYPYSEKPRSQPFDKGFVHTKYEVLETVEMGDYHFPSKSIMKLFCPIPGKNDLALVREYIISTTNISDNAYAKSFVPEISGIVSVIDQRFIDEKISIKNIYYRITNATWLSKSDVVKMKAYDTARKTMKSKREEAISRHEKGKWFKKSRIAVVATMGLFSIVALLFYKYVNRSNSSYKN